MSNYVRTYAEIDYRPIKNIQELHSVVTDKYELITDLGSGMNYYKKGLTNLINQILNDEVKRLVITHKDRLLRFGAELIFSICEAKEVEVVIINKGQEKASFEEDLAKDVRQFIKGCK